MKCEPRQPRRVVRFGVHGCLGRADSGLLQVERHDRQADGHVLERLVHGAVFVEIVRRIRADRQVRGGEGYAHLLVRNSPGECQVLFTEPQAGRQRSHRVELVSAPHGQEANLARSGGLDRKPVLAVE